MDPALAIEVAEMSKQKAMNEALQRGDSEIQKFYAGRVVLLTGGSGFMGKHLIEKLLRACNLKLIYILLRPKKGKSVEQRLEDVLMDPVYENLRNRQPNFKNKLVPIVSDMTEIGLGISTEDVLKLTNEVEIIIHAAATTRFDDPLKKTTLTNVRGVRDLLALARRCKKLISFVYVSTAYSAATYDNINTEVLEKFYPTPINPNTLINLAEQLNDETLENITPGLIKRWPNTYTFSKIVAEDLIRSNAKELPICLIRPPIVIASALEPSPGWLDKSCAFGATGIIIGPGLGVIHAAIIDKDVKMNMMPVDMVNNSIIVAGWETSRRWVVGDRDIQIYNISNSRNPIVSGELSKLVKIKGQNLQTPKAIWYTYVIESKYKSVVYLLTWFLHFIPAYFVDGILSIIGKQPMLIKIYTKAWKINSLLSYFMINEWTFVDNNTLNLYQSLSKTDQNIFPFDCKTLNWGDMILVWIIGIRKYIVEDGLKNTDLALKKQFWFRILHYIVSAIYLYAWWKFLTFLYSILCTVFNF
ncbi:fatty acyl-CoA reductase wat-like [Galleria mellonella]|uniref:Fatty acyl-CoA reductase n=1 Tax=Galleria mellonella TaxID=7137 RepID=A0A6J3BVT9_GALME|nr:fatty acyl-CoA reductase wat-like [Galleria mellonella]XP_031764021.2 fatty acyl-CoA reductase wat-like [Galleria mellonella]XP_052749129.1 fatty acyl-CoA reductase wat-like [Galleria mellonella]